MFKDPPKIWICHPPTFQTVSFFITKFCCCCWIKIGSFHHKNCWFPLEPSSNAFHPPYFDSIIFAHGSSCLENRSHLHFPNRAALKVLGFLIPRPPLSFGWHTVFQLTQAIFLSSDPPPHRKRLWMASNLAITFEGILKKEKINRNCC